MPTARIKIQGERTLKALVTSPDRALAEAVAYELADQAQQTVPVDSGELRDSMTIEEQSRGVAVKFNAKYAAAVEATRNNFLERAVERVGGPEITLGADGH